VSDHDQRFKVLLKEFFAEFLALFFPQQAARFDYSRLEWLDKEVFADPPQGEVLIADLVARLPLRAPATGEPISAVALVHVEVESRDAVNEFRRRMFEYYEALRRRYGCPVLPIAVYLRVGLDGIGIDGYDEDFDGLAVLRFQYLYVGLPGLDAVRYVEGGSWLGVGLSALMRVPRLRRAWLRSEALRRLVVECKENPYRQWLLLECVEAYADLDEEQRREYEALLQTEQYKEIAPMMTTTFEKGVAKGREEGREEALQATRRLLQRQLEIRFGPLPEAVAQKLNNLPVERLEEIGVALISALSLAELGLK
jgi:hypothetical protein